MIVIFAESAEDDDDDKSSVNPLLTSGDFFSLFPNIFSVLQTPSLKPWWQG